MFHKVHFMGLMKGDWSVLRKDMQDVKDQVLDAKKKRLKILGDDEIDVLYGQPRFTYEERVQYFSLSLSEV